MYEHPFPAFPLHLPNYLRAMQGRRRGNEANFLINDADDLMQFCIFMVSYSFSVTDLVAAAGSLKLNLN